EDTRQPRDLLEREDLVTAEPLQPFGRHAVRAPEVALVRDGDPDRADPPSPAVDERFHPPSVPVFCGIHTAQTTPPFGMEVHMADLRWETGNGDDDGGSGAPPPSTGGDNDCPRRSSKDLGGRLRAPSPRSERIRA